MKITGSLIPALFCLVTAVNAQEKQKSYDPSSQFVGGSISLGFSGGGYASSLIGLHPHYGYTIAKWIDAAAVVNFEYQTVRDPYNNKYHNTTYGVGAFTRIFPVHFLFIQAQPEYNFISEKVIPSAGISSKQNLHAPSFLVGGGYTTSRSGKNTFTYLSVLFDIAKNPNSPYVDGYGNILPIVRAGINIGLNKRRKG